MRSTRPAMRISAPKAVAKKPLWISASVKVLRSAARRLVICASSAHACASEPVSTRRTTTTERAASRKSGRRRKPRRARLQRADAIGEAALAVFAVRIRGLNRGLAGAVGARRVLDGENRVDLRVGPFERRGEARDLRRHIVDALAQERVLDPLGGPGRLRLALHRGKLRS